MNNTTSLSSLIWSSADDVLRGLFKPSEYGRVILPFVVMRRLDCVLEPHKDDVYDIHTKYKSRLKDTAPVILRQTKLRFFNTSKYDLSRIKSDPNNVKLNLDNYIQGYSQNVHDIIENFSIDPLIDKLYKHNRLYLLIDKFTEFDLHPGEVDNHRMGSVYEELLRKFSEMSNEESGDHFTPRDVVKLLVSFVFGGDKVALQGKGKIRSVLDPCCGTGGMLTIGKDWVLENINPDLRVNIYGQELNDVTYSICKSDLLMLDENPENIQGPRSSISDDRYQGSKFEYMITNPPFGVSWKSEEEFVKEEAKDPNGRFFVGTPRTSDGSLLFLQHLIHKMEPKGSRIGIVFNGSPLFTGDAGGGESEIRKWIIENDWLECIVSLPDRMFFNTGITTYFWIVANKKSPERKGKVQLIDGSSFFTPMSPNLGNKNKIISEEQAQQLFKIYQDNQENEFCKIYSNSHFGYTKVAIERINRLETIFSEENIDKLRYSKRSVKIAEFSRWIYSRYGDMVYDEKFYTRSQIDEIRVEWEELTRTDDGKVKQLPKEFLDQRSWQKRLELIMLANDLRAEFKEDVYTDFEELYDICKKFLKRHGQKVTNLKKVLREISHYSPTSERVIKSELEKVDEGLDESNGIFYDNKRDKYVVYESDNSFSDWERVPLNEDIKEYYYREVKPHLPESWVNRSKDKIGYEINFTKYFYKFKPLRSLEEISRDLKALDVEIEQLSVGVTDE